MQNAILIISFGTSIPKAQSAIYKLVNAAKISFPDYEVRLAFTSRIIRRKLSNAIPNPVEALAELNEENFSRVIMIPTLMIPGQEFDDLKKIHAAFTHLSGSKYGFEVLKVGTPFLNGPRDCEIMTEILIKKFKSHLHDKNTGIILMGHGTSEHFAHALYSQLQMELDNKAHGKFFVGTVEAAPMIENVIANLKRNSEIDKLILSPLMITAGEHANNDLADKWLNVFKREGYENITCELKGLGEDENMINYFVDKIRALTH